MHGKTFIHIKAQIQDMRSLGYQTAEIVHILNLLHFVRELGDKPVNSPTYGYDDCGNIYADGQLIT